MIELFIETAPLLAWCDASDTPTWQTSVWQALERAGVDGLVVDQTAQEVQPQSHQMNVSDAAHISVGGGFQPLYTVTPRWRVTQSDLGAQVQSYLQNTSHGASSLGRSVIVLDMGEVIDIQTFGTLEQLLVLSRPVSVVDSSVSAIDEDGVLPMPTVSLFEVSVEVLPIFEQVQAILNTAVSEICLNLTQYTAWDAQGIDTLRDLTHTINRAGKRVSIRVANIRHAVALMPIEVIERVQIGHAVLRDALLKGLELTVREYKAQLITARLNPTALNLVADQVATHSSAQINRTLIKEA